MAPDPAPDPPARGHRLAVLPLANISPDPNDEYFADGMTEELIAALSKIAELAVIARTSAMRFKGSSLGVAAIAKELNVQTVVEGSVRKAGRRLRITVQLVDPTSESPLWSQDYDRELEDVFAIQREIARRVARSLRVRIREHEAERLDRAATEVVDAYTMYLKGRFAWNQRTAEGLRLAITEFDRALEKDRRFALAETGRADAYAALALLEISPPTEAFPKAREAAERALALDPNLAEAHASLGLVRFQYDRDWVGAEAELRKAIELNPNYPAAHQYFADYLKAMGRLDEALAEMRRAGELDPLSLAIATGIGHVLYLSRQYDRAIEQYRKATTLDPTFVQAHLWFGRPYLQKGMYDEAIHELTQAVQLSGGSTISLAVLGHAYASAGREAEARAILAQLLDRSKERYLPSYWIALLYTGLGDEVEALRWLGRAYEERSSWLVWIKVEPRFDRLRANPAFVSLLARMGLAGSASPAGPDPSLVEFIGHLEELRPSRFRVVGGYTRHDDTARHLLKDLRAKIAGRLGGSSARIENFLLWSPPGGGKSFFVQETSKSLGPGVRYREINLAELDEPAYRSALAEAAATTTPTIAFVDEVDGRPTEPWPYEALIPHLEAKGARAAPLVFVVAGSSGHDLAEMRRAILARPKGSDLLSRIPRENEYAIPPMTAPDRVLVATANLRAAAERQHREILEIEKLALYYVGAAAELGNARRLRDFTARCVERMPPGEERVKFDTLFDAGDPRNKEFWLWARSNAPTLAGAFVPIGE
ncbi:MAG: tetratricopeptide repeat protein [Thermoplasmata archaeon]|nr:tetratricopeptide repeat protein [Thermoplasmata archaeon]